ncbi:nucleoside-diphosphate kinase [ANME-2 cluster archaeon]|nr:MAG: nucleoside-diphosphate kinase [ANME-2 cluster archaeon]RLG20776.1 MAG: nucleoside-diphosphate kinase [Methanosarcinales archaeon]
MEQTFVMIKPDGVQRGLIGEIISRIERKGLRIVAMRMCQITDETARRHYAEHVEKPFFSSLVDFITSSPVVQMIVEGENAVVVMRTMSGATDPKEALIGTIRGDFGLDVGRNLIHSADSLESAKREIAIHFTEEDVVEYTKADETWVYE